MRSSRIRLIAVGLSAMLALGGCAITSGKPHGGGPGHSGQSLSNGKSPAWPLKDLAQINARRVMLMAEEKPFGTVDIAPMRTGWAAASRLLEAADVSPDIVVITGRPANAFASIQDGKPLVAVNFGMAELLGEDADAWAALLGHELAHLSLRHNEIRQKRRSVEDAGSGLLGLALEIAGVPFGSAVADASVTLVGRGYTRDDEREADRAGVALMVRAGFNPEGAVRLQEQLAKTGDAADLPFLSTHPGSEERVATMRALVREYAVSKEVQKQAD